MECEGCALDDPSQLHHKCLLPATPEEKECHWDVILEELDVANMIEIIDVNGTYIPFSYYEGFADFAEEVRDCQVAINVLKMVLWVNL